MRFVICCVFLCAIAACKKDKFTTEPQIKYVSLKPNYWESGFTVLQKDQAPKIRLKVTDAEGDLGITANDTAFVVIKHLLTNVVDTLNFPPLGNAAGKNFDVDVEVNLFNALRPFCPAGGPVFDTVRFEVFVVDYAKHKSNVIVTEDPVFYKCR